MSRKKQQQKEQVELEQKEKEFVNLQLSYHRSHDLMRIEAVRLESKRNPNTGIR